MELVCLGKVVKLHGYLGQMKITTEIDKGFDINTIKELTDDKGTTFKVTRIFKNTDAVVVALEGVDLEKSKTYIGRYFYANREIVSGKILIEDLKDSIVFVGETEIGKVKDVQDYGSAEVFYVELLSGRELMFPNVKGIIISFDYKAKKLVVDESKLKEVSDYEN